MHVSFLYIAGEDETHYTVEATVVSDAPDHRSYSVGFESIKSESEGLPMPEEVFVDEEEALADHAVEEAKDEALYRARR